jgi:DNA-binding GntR family transcriptional regulator
MQNNRIELRRNRDEVAQVLRDLIASGEMIPGARLDEVKLSERLGVSRTPIREAIIGLEHEGWVKSVPNKGARVVAADERLVEEIYPILAALEAEAVLATGPALADAAGDLRRINGELAREKESARQYALDAELHRRLVEQCGNQQLLRLVERLWGIAARFNGAEDRGTANHQGSCAQHDAIIDAIAAGEIEHAAKLVRQHWHEGIEVVKQWLQSKD